MIVDMQGKLIGTADKPLWQYDYGQTVSIQGTDIPDGTIAVHFEAKHDEGVIVTAGSALGGTVTAEIPDQLLALPMVWNYAIMCYVFVTTEGTGTTKYTAMLEVAHRGAQTGVEPTPEEQSAWDQAMAELAAYQEEIDAAVDEIVIVSDEEPESEYNKLWIDADSEVEYTVPTCDEHGEITGTVVFKAVQMRYKDEQGEYHGINSVSDETTADQIEDIEAAGLTAQAGVAAKGQEVIASIPQDYTTMSNDVVNLKGSSSNDWDYEKQISVSDIISGSYDIHGKPTARTDRIRVKSFVRVKKGSKFVYEPGSNVYGIYIGYFDLDFTFDYEEEAWITTKITKIFQKDYYLVIVFKNAAGSDISPSDYDATVVIESVEHEAIKGINQIASKYAQAPIYMPPLVFEQGSLDSTGNDKINPDYPGAKRMRTAGYVRIIDEKPICFDVPDNMRVYVCLFDDQFQFIRWYEYLEGANPVVPQTQGAKWIRFVVWNSNNSDVVQKATDSIRIMQTTGLTPFNSINPDVKYGGLVDYTGQTNSAYYANRVCTDYLPIYNSRSLISLPEGYSAYLFEFDENFEFIKERGWMYFTSYYGLNDSTKYIRLVVRKNDESNFQDSDITDLADMNIKYDTMSRLKPNNAILLEPALIAHRGDSDAPENTLPAIEKAIEKGYKHIEVDIQFTSDGVCVLLHDNTIDRTSDGTGAIYNMTYEAALQYDFGSWKSQEYAGTKIPTLEEALLLCKKNKVVLQIDFNDPNKSNITYHNVADMLEIIKQCGMESNVNLCCREFHMRYSAYLNPNIALCSGVYTDADIAKVKDIADEVSLLVGSMQYTSSVTKSTIKARHGNNMLFQTWTIDDAETADDLFNNGADWLITEALAPTN